MTPRALLAAVGATLVLTVAPAAAADVESDLKQMTQELLDAIAPGKVEVWQRYLHDKMIHLDENGVVRDKAAMLKEIKPLPAGLVGRIEVDKFRVTLQGDVAVAAVEVQESLDYHGQNLRSRFRSLDTWVRTPEGWRLIGQHTAAVLKDPPATRLTRADMCGYSGVYQLTPEITTTIQCTEDSLVSERTGRPAVAYLPEVRDLFFAAGQPRSRRLFQRDASGKVTGFVDRREGEDIRWQRTGDVSK